MFGDVAQQMMKIMGKEAGSKGIVTVEQLPDAIAKLREAVAADRARHGKTAPEDLPQTETAADGSKRPFVTLAQRAIPLIELLEYSLKRGKPVVWGV